MRFEYWIRMAFARRKFFEILLINFMTVSELAVIAGINSIKRKKHIVERLSKSISTVSSNLKMGLNWIIG